MLVSYLLHLEVGTVILGETLVLTSTVLRMEVRVYSSATVEVG